MLHCTYENLELGDIKPAEKYERLLMFTAFFDGGHASSTSFDVWKCIFPLQKLVYNYKNFDECVYRSKVRLFYIKNVSCR